MVEHKTTDRTDSDSIPRPSCRNLGNFVHYFLCLLEETLKAASFYVGSMPGEVKDPVKVEPVVNSLILKMEKFRNQRQYSAHK